MIYDLHDAYGQYVATYGAEGPVTFASNLEKQTIQEVNTIRDRLASGAYAGAPQMMREEVARTNDAVEEALYNNDTPRLWVNATNCLTWGRADQGWNNRAKYKMYCLPWQDNLTAATVFRREALLAMSPYSAQPLWTLRQQSHWLTRRKPPRNKQRMFWAKGRSPTRGYPLGRSTPSVRASRLWRHVYFCPPSLPCTCASDNPGARPRTLSAYAEKDRKWLTEDAALRGQRQADVRAWG